MEAEIQALFIWKTHAYPPPLAKLAKWLENILHIIKNYTKDYDITEITTKLAKSN